jgi:phosphoenolpyruvate-protein phosphotransferase (PTS system enzyme I)
LIEDSCTEEIWLQGRAVVPGVAIGSLFFLPELSLPFREDPSESPICVTQEIRRFTQAVAESQAELRFLFEKLKKEGFCQEADIVDMHLQMTVDPSLCEEVEHTIFRKEQRAENGVAEVMEKLRLRFEKIPDATIRQRFEDVESVCLRILSFLTSPSKEALRIPSLAILFAKTVTPTVVAEMSVNGIGAIVTTHGGAMSHTAIVAKARGIPYVTDIQCGNFRDSFSGASVVVDGLAGLVIVCPTNETMRRYKALKESHDAYFRGNVEKPVKGGLSKDGCRISLMANVSGVNDVRQLSAFGLDGVGLYRTEYQVLERRRFPTEREQTDAYSEMVKAADNKPVVIRVFDFGSDKGWEEVSSAFPTLAQGQRTIDLLLQNPDLFLAHLRAIIRSSVYGRLSIMFPMITSIEELERCLDMVGVARGMVQKEHPIKRIRVGAMVEIPSLAFRTESLGGKIDFISIGTNDLIQYSLAVDRSNGASFDARLSYHPGLLRLLGFIVQESGKVKIPVCLCGEMASDPLLIPFLVGLGIKELSIAPRLSPMVKHVLQSFSIQEMEHIANSVLSFTSAQEAYAFLRAQYCTLHSD